MTDNSSKFDDVKARLDEIAGKISADGVSLDEALVLYEEAVSLGLAACDLSEKDVLAAPDDVAGGESDGAAAGNEPEAAVSAGEADDSKDVEDGEDTTEH